VTIEATAVLLPRPFFARHVEVAKLSPAQAGALDALWTGLQGQDGIRSRADVLRWILDQVAAQAPRDVRACLRCSTLVHGGAQTCERCTRHEEQMEEIRHPELADGGDLG